MGFVAWRYWQSFSIITIHVFLTTQEACTAFAGMVCEFPFFKYGFYGVQLFFSVSGFVIVMTLERSGGLIEFAVKRLARLWPTMWPVFWRRNPQDFLPSLTFLDSYVVWKKVLPGIQFS